MKDNQNKKKQTLNTCKKENIQSIEEQDISFMTLVQLIH